jgi:hypothetical protein
MRSRRFSQEKRTVHQRSEPTARQLVEYVLAGGFDQLSALAAVASPPRQRLMAFLDADGRTGHQEHRLDRRLRAGHQRQSGQPGLSRLALHVRALIAEARPELDVELLAHVLLGSLHSDPIVHQLRSGESDRPAACLRDMVDSLLGG